MMNKRLIQIVAILAVGLLITILYISGKNSSSANLNVDPKAKLPDQSDWDYNLASAIELELEKDSVSVNFGDLYQIKSDPIDSISWLPKVAAKWDSLGHSLFAGYYFEKLAKKTNSAENWYEAGFRFFNLLNRTNDSFARNEIGAHAINSLQKTVELDPNNLKAKSELGVSYMEIMPAGVTPMMGVGLLREVLQQDSSNIEALYYLAYLSMKSGQYDKAVERLTKLTELQPDVASYYEYLANAYLQAGNKEKATESITRYAELTNSESAREKADQFIKQFNN